MTNNPVIVIEEKKRRTGLVWFAGGVAALLLGGSTFALWSASDGFAGSTITAGDLNISVDEASFWDVSADRADSTTSVPGTDGSQKGHPLKPSDGSTWRMVPGDKVAAAFSSDITLEGDNLVGQLTLDGLQNNELENKGMTYSFEVYQAGKKIVGEKALPTTGQVALADFSAPATGQDSGLEDADGTTVLPMTDTTENLTIVIYGSFDASTEKRDQVTAKDTLADLELSLKQIRDTGAQFVAQDHSK